MNTLELIKHHQTELDNLSNKAQEIGLFIASDSWDTLEREVEDFTSDGIQWDFVENMPYAWALQLGVGFDIACEKWIEKRFHDLDDSMQEAMGQDWCYDLTRTMLDNLRQSLRIGNQYESQFTKLLQNAKPGLLEIARRAWIDDEDYILNHMDEDSIKDGEKVRQQFYQAREQATVQLAKIASELIQRSVELYRTALSQAASSVLLKQQAS